MHTQGGQYEPSWSIEICLCRRILRDMDRRAEEWSGVELNKYRMSADNQETKDNVLGLHYK